MIDQRRRIAIIKVEMNKVFKRTLGYRETSIKQTSRLTLMRINKTCKVNVIVKLASRPNV